MSQQKRNSLGSMLFLGLVIVLCLSMLWQMDTREGKLEYSQVRQLLEQEKVEALRVATDGTLTLTLREELNGSKQVSYKLYSFQLFYDDMNDLVLEQYHKGIIKSYDYPKPQTTNWFSLLLPYVAMAVVLGLLWYFLVLRAQGGGMGGDKMARFGTARTRVLTDQDKKVTF